MTVQISDARSNEDPIGERRHTLLTWGSAANIVPSGNIGQAVLGMMAFLVFAVI
jgi:hypothetical protein